MDSEATFALILLECGPPPNPPKFAAFEDHHGYNWTTIRNRLSKLKAKCETYGVDWNDWLLWYREKQDALNR